MEHWGLWVRWFHVSPRWDPRAGRRGDPSPGGASRVSHSLPWARASDLRLWEQGLGRGGVASGLREKRRLFFYLEKTDENWLENCFYL